jgi:hypothetical protein
VTGGAGRRFHRRWAITVARGDAAMESRLQGRACRGAAASADTMVFSDERACPLRGLYPDWCGVSAGGVPWRGRPRGWGRRGTLPVHRGRPPRGHRAGRTIWAPRHGPLAYPTRLSAIRPISGVASARPYPGCRPGCGVSENTLRRRDRRRQRSPRGQPSLPLYSSCRAVRREAPVVGYALVRVRGRLGDLRTPEACPVRGTRVRDTTCDV